jgi:hypothetical protein
MNMKTLKLALLSAMIGAVAFAQSVVPVAPCKTNPAEVPVATSVPLQQQFDAAYVLSLPTPVQALFPFVYIGNPGVCTLVGTESFAAYVAQYQSFVAQGYGNYLPSVGIGGDPYSVFLTLSALGETWIPNAGQIPLGLPGQYSLPGVTPQIGYSLGAYPTSQPTGWITVPAMSLLTSANANVSALLAAWFPPYAPPTAPTPTAFVSCVGIAEGAGYYAANLTAPGCNILINGQVYTADPRGAFTFIQSANPFSPGGVSSYFTAVN